MEPLLKIYNKHTLPIILLKLGSFKVKQHKIMNTPKNRKRNSLGLSETGKTIIVKEAKLSHI